MKNNDNINLINALDLITTRFLKASSVEQISAAVDAVIEDSFSDLSVTCLYLFSNRLNRFHLVQSRGLSSNEQKLAQQHLMDGFPGKVIRDRKLLHIPDCNNEHSSDLWSNGDNEIGSWLFLPVLDNDKIVGVLGAGSLEKNYFSDDKITALSFVANLTSLIFGNIQLLSKLRTEHSMLAEKVSDKTASLQQAFDDLSRDSVHKDEFLENMSHELLYPLDTLMDLSGAILEGIYGPLEEKQKSTLQTVHNSGQRLLLLINDVLDIAQIRAGKMLSEPIIILADELCDGLFPDLKKKTKRYEVKFVGNCEIGDETIWADSGHLGKIIEILFDSILELTPVGGTVEIGVESKRGRVLISISGNKFSLSANEQMSLLHPFGNFEGGSLPKRKGSGLGLFLAKQLAELNGGGIVLESDDKQVTRFVLTLPGEKPPEKNLSTIPADQRAACRVLYAEDNPLNVKTVTEYLEAFGMTVVSAENGELAVELAIAIQPDVILMDIQMPRMGGLEATRNIRKIPALKDTPIIALTAFATDEDRAICLDAGCHEFMSKPVSMKTLVSTIQSLLD